MLNLDFTSVKGFDPLPEGDYIVKVTNVTEKVSQSGNDLLNMEYTVVAGDDDGRRVFDNFVLTEKSLWRFKQFLTTVGIKAVGKESIDTNDIIGKVLMISVGIDEYNGVERNKVSKFLKAPAEYDLI
jgi:hypothetical protein